MAAHRRKDHSTDLFKFPEPPLTFRQFQAVITTLTGSALVGTAPAKSAEAILAFLQSYGRVAEVELREVFDLNGVELAMRLDSAELKSRIRFSPAGNGGFWEASPATMTCDTNTGQCTV